jgi:hypothetical protein
LGNDSPNGLVPHSGNMHGLLLALELLGCSSWLLGQEGMVPDCYDVDTDFLPAGGSDGIAAAAEETTSGTAAADSEADAGAGGLALIAEVGCLSSGDGCYSRPEIHQSCVSYHPSPGASFQS